MGNRIYGDDDGGEDGDSVGGHGGGAMVEVRWWRGDGGMTVIGCSGDDDDGDVASDGN